MILILSAGDGNQKRGGIPSWTFPRGTGGHTGPPVCEHRSVQQPQTGRDGARPLQGPEQEGGGVRLGGSGVWSPRPTGASQVVPSEGPMYLRHGFRRPNFVPKFGASVIGSGPYEKEGKPPRPPGPAAHSEASAPAVARDGWGSEQRSSPKGPSTSDKSLSRPDGRQLPLHKGAFGDGGCGLPRRFAPRNDSPDPLSFRGGPTGRRGNPSFLRWTGVRAAEIVGPYGKKGKLPRPPGQRLAKRKARKEQLVKFRNEI